LDATTKEVADLVLRWVHLIAGIMWVGNSMLFNWLDRNLVKVEGAKEGHLGEIWMVHSGGFYQIEKKFLAPGQMPQVLHWFKWQSYTTWLSGMLLLGVVYYHGGRGMLVDPAVRDLSLGAATGIGFGFLALGFLVYDLLWRSPLAKREGLATAVSLALLAGAAYALHHLLTGRAAYLHTGAMLGTIMAGNVFFHIIPSQRHLVAATIAGSPQDPAFADRAKKRSIHNNYMTFPVLFIMISNHFPSTYGNELNYVVLAVLCVSGALVRHWMNIRFWFRPWLPAAAATVVIGLGTLFALLSQRAQMAALAELAQGEKVSITAVRAIVQKRCIACHATVNTDPVWKVAANGVIFETPEQLKLHAERIITRVVVNRTMPLGNQTGITEEEREIIGRWVLQGARTE